MFVPGGPDRHLIVGEDALRDLLLTDLDVSPGVTDTALNELRTRGRHTIENILVTSKIQNFWRLDTTPTPTAPEAKPTAPALAKPAKRKGRRAASLRRPAKPKSARKGKRKNRSRR